MDINTAEELRMKVKEFRTKELIKMEGWLPGLLEGSAENGNSEYSTIDKNMKIIIENNKEKLEKLGYKVDTDGMIFTISWE